MPLFDFECINCGTRKEHLVKANVKTLPCPKCGFPSYKKMGAAKFKMEGDGFYKSKAGLQ